MTQPYMHKGEARVMRGIATLSVRVVLALVSSLARPTSTSDSVAACAVRRPSYRPAKPRWAPNASATPTGMPTRLMRAPLARRVGAAAEDAAASRLWAVAELAEARDGERHGREEEDVHVRREQAAPVAADGHHEGGGCQAHAHIDGDGGADGAPRPRRAVRAYLGADARGRALAQRG